MNKISKKIVCFKFFSIDFQGSHHSKNNNKNLRIETGQRKSIEQQQQYSRSWTLWDDSNSNVTKNE